MAYPSICHNFKCLGHVFVLNAPATAWENSTTMTSRAYSWDTLLLIITSTTLISRQVSLKPVITRSLTKHGIYTRNNRWRLNSYTTSGWNMMTTSTTLPQIPLPVLLRQTSLGHHLKLHQPCQQHGKYPQPAMSPHSHSVNLPRQSLVHHNLID
jgi:hypothetical protein